MNPFVIFIVGLLVGWLVEWVIDWIYWREKVRAARVEGEESCRGQIISLEGEIASYRSQLATLQGEAARSAERSQDEAGCQEQVTALQTEIEAYRSQIAALQGEAARSAESSEVEARYRQQLTTLEGEVASYRSQIDALKSEAGERESRPPQAQSETARVRDPLTDIPGIDNDLTRDLNAAGIYSFAELAALSPNDLRSLVTGSKLPGSAVEIIKQARVRVGSIKQADDLTAIVGIGPVIAQTLNAAGIFSFKELAQLNAEQLVAIVGDRIQRLADEEDILAQARQLAGLQA
jgi:predicted flap endonuclease-1-like 5' DNA nuclease